MAEFRFVESQLDRLSEITANLGILFFATSITPLITKIDIPTRNQLTWGLILALASWWISLRLARVSKK